MMVSHQTSAVPPHHLTTIRPLVDSLYDSTRQSTALINQTHNELGLLLSVLAATESRSSALYADRSPPALDQKLQSCHAILLDIQSLQNKPGEIGLQAQITEIRARISSLVFELNVMNADMMICSQNKVNRLLGDFIEDVRGGKREPSVITDALNDAAPISEQNQAWGNLQKELLDVGITSHASIQDHDFIISTLRQEVEEKELLKNIKPKPKPLETVEPPKIIVSSPTGTVKRQVELKPEVEPDVSPEVTAEEEKRPKLPPRPQDSGLSGLFEKEVVVTKGVPTPATMHPQAGVSDAEKQVFPTEDYPIPVAVENLFNGADDSDKQAFAAYDCPLAIPTAEEFSAAGNFDKQVVFDSRESQSIPKVPRDTRPDTSPRDVSGGNGNPVHSSLSRHSKKPSIMHKMKYRLMNSKEDFITQIQTNRVDAVKKALEKGANVDTMNLDEQTALMVACSYGHESIVRLLLQYGADAERASWKGETALGVAAGRGQESIVRVLLACGACVNSKGRGNPGISEAAASGYGNIVRLMLDHGADPNVTRRSGLTALSRAAFNGHLDVCRLLLDNGAKVDHTCYSMTNSTALRKAVDKGRTEVVRLLMERGADPLRKDYSGNTIVSVARQSDRADIVQIFRQYGYWYESTPVQYY